jgi:hypothetical protein
MLIFLYNMQDYYPLLIFKPSLSILRGQQP